MKIESIEAPDIPPLRDEEFVRFLAERDALHEYIDRVTGDVRNFLTCDGDPDPGSYIDNAFVWGTVGSPHHYWDNLNEEWLKVLTSQGGGSADTFDNLGRLICEVAGDLPCGTALQIVRTRHRVAVILTPGDGAPVIYSARPAGEIVGYQVEVQETLHELRERGGSDE